ncbi:MAG: proprotein convertase P-domain-containing protein, partial [Planctomycetota bacterium]|nr:proprotein convertase P-domain-containing protein [Planctomycetota bacterium]
MKWLLLLLVLVPGLVVADVEVCENPEIDFGGANGTPQQVTSIVSITDSFIIQDLQVVVDISHPFIGDLTVDLDSPGGTSLRLHDSDGGDTENILVTYSDDGIPNGSEPYSGGCYMQPSTGSLALFDGEQVAGSWTL